MKKSKVIFIGAIDIGNIATNGETMKNQLLLRRFNDIYDRVIAVDTNNWRNRPWCLLHVLWSLIWNHATPVVISASISSSLLFKFLYYFPLKKNVNNWVIGGALHTQIRDGQYSLKSLKNLNRVIVEGKGMATELKKMGLNNVVWVPNFKPIEYTPKISPKGKNEMFRFIFLSRIHPEKGIQEIVTACKELIAQGYKNYFTIDFFGAIEPKFEADFHTMISDCSNLQYKGFLNLTNNDGYETLSHYDVMLFPTYWASEGFPGAVIDAYIAGLPVIASEWNMNNEVVIDGETGYIIPVHDSHALAIKMKHFIDKQIDLYEMRTHCAGFAKQFDYRNVVTKDLLKELHLL